MVLAETWDRTVRARFATRRSRGSQELHELLGVQCPELRRAVIPGHRCAAGVVDEGLQLQLEAVVW
jgi:hypothetical protein